MFQSIGQITASYSNKDELIWTFALFDHSVWKSIKFVVIFLLQRSQLGLYYGIFFLGNWALILGKKPYN